MLQREKLKTNEKLNECVLNQIIYDIFSFSSRVKLSLVNNKLEKM